jgi:2-polyprenyl-3-methyl-5-hydroxy-6-metoxy-1,4-benzoquinol methylase
LTSSLTETEQIEARIKACYSTWSERYYAEYYKSDAAYPPVHTDIVRELLRAEDIQSVLDAGCGPASMLRDLADLGLDLYGFDLTPEMVTEAQRIMSGHGLTADRIWQGSVLEGAPFTAAPDGRKRFDAGICFGVLPHIPAGSEAAVIANFKQVIRPGGLVAIEARNELFSLFTVNRYSRAFFQDRLLAADGLRQRAGAELEGLDQALQQLDERFRMDLPPVRKGYDTEPGYDEVLSRLHNPFELAQLARTQGLVDVRVLFYHYHALPPMLQASAPELFRRESLAMEDPNDWRGHFMASAFILVGRVP